MGDDETTMPALLTAAMSASPGLGRKEAREALFILVDEFYLSERDGRFHFVNPLFRDWWRLYGGPV